MTNHNIILNTDSYKVSMSPQYPPKTTHVYSYIESRGGIHDHTVFFGLQAFIKEYLIHPITTEMVDEAEELWTAHGMPFIRENWDYIVSKHGGRLPISIKAVPEGTVLPNRNVMVTIENTDPKCFWLTTFLETALLRAIWYPSTVATNSRAIKEIINEALEKSGDPAGLPFKLHDFGSRGVSSQESAMLGGMAHLVNFMGTDTISAVLGARRYYNEPMAAFSIPAAEHSTITSWGRENEIAAYRNMLTQFAKPGALLAVVSDSYDIFNAVSELWGKELRQEVIESGATLVIRPDSGNPTEVVLECLQRLEAAFGVTLNAKGYKVLNTVRVIQGDGVRFEGIKEILKTILAHGFSADNVTFGMGGALLQALHRDDQEFAMKCSAVNIDGAWRNVFKDPITDSGKRSKQGRLALVRDSDFGWNTMPEPESILSKFQNHLELVYLDGVQMREHNFSSIRERAAL